MFLPCAQWQDLVEWLVVFRGSLGPKSKQTESHRDTHFCMKFDACQCTYENVRVDSKVVIAVNAPILNLVNLLPLCSRYSSVYAVVWSLHLDFQLLDADVSARGSLVAERRRV